MSTSHAKYDPPRAQSITIMRMGRRLYLLLVMADSCIAGVPLALYPSLVKATAKQRERVRPIGRGVGFHWPDLDLDLSVEDILARRPEHIPKRPVRQSA